LTAGPVGVGKSSTLLAIKCLAPLWEVRPEPLEAWERAVMIDGSERNLLRDFYDLRDARASARLEVVRRRRRQIIRSPSRGVCHFQSQVVLSLLERYEASSRSSAPVQVYERSIMVSREVFVEAVKDLLDVEDRTFVSRLCAYGEAAYEGEASRFYLSCSDGEMTSRVRGRARPSEANLR
jgi:Deoxynucleoside kinase